MADLKVSKLLNSLPVTLVSNTLYFIKTGNTVRQYLSTDDGSQAIEITAADPEIHPFLLMGLQNA